jgi:hypothetical protein
LPYKTLAEIAFEHDSIWLSAFSEIGVIKSDLRVWRKLHIMRERKEIAHRESTIATGYTGNGGRVSCGRRESDHSGKWKLYGFAQVRRVRTLRF